MKIGLLTQPLHTNYGGIIQAYALKTILEQEGYEVWFIDRESKPVSTIKKMGSIVKRVILKYFLRKDIIVRVWSNNKEEKLIRQHLHLFIKKNFKFTQKIKREIDFSTLKTYNFTTFIVGSDQVWRPKYSPCITNYFFDFLNGNHSIRKIAYAASFGVDNWEFSPEQTELCAALAKQIDAISVREDSAINLCEKHLGVEAIHVLDPSMLLSKEDYINLIEQEKISKRDNILFTYILDESEEKLDVIHKIEKELNLNIVSGMPLNSFHNKKSKEDLSDCVFISIMEWLAGFRDAKFVITDSFHGTVFSIIFNKPFVVFVNKDRGNARFDSLLKLFKLENRLITTNEIVPYLYELDYSEVNKILVREREKSMNYLMKELNV
jgi:hypothetical protein